MCLRNEFTGYPGEATQQRLPSPKVAADYSILWIAYICILWCSPAFQALLVHYCLNKHLLNVKCWGCKIDVVPAFRPSLTQSATVTTSWWRWAGELASFTMKKLKFRVMKELCTSERGKVEEASLWIPNSVLFMLDIEEKWLRMDLSRSRFDAMGWISATNNDMYGLGRLFCPLSLGFIVHKRR